MLYMPQNMQHHSSAALPYIPAYCVTAAVPQLKAFQGNTYQ